MRFWIPALAGLTLVVAAPAEVSAQKRSTALSVRVTVVRSCSVNTATPSPSGSVVNCDPKIGPPVRTTSSTFTTSSQTAPAAVQSTTPATVQSPAIATATPAAPPTGVAEDGTPLLDASAVAGDSDAGAPETDTLTEPVAPVRTALQVLTLNF